mmetsp:Transcript_17223/g.37140  ORF Transcript_17223/g.37140 Transcript_17223/m.37140 type:complete len:214 (+) Transcript_17223:1697-2338(+)
MLWWAQWLRSCAQCCQKTTASAAMRCSPRCYSRNLTHQPGSHQHPGTTHLARDLARVVQQQLRQRQGLAAGSGHLMAVPAPSCWTSAPSRQRLPLCASKQRSRGTRRGRLCRPCVCVGQSCGRRCSAMQKLPCTSSAYPHHQADGRGPVPLAAAPSAVAAARCGQAPEGQAALLAWTQTSCKASRSPCLTWSPRLPGSKLWQEGARPGRRYAA